jgi:hypothetical protein
MEAYGHRARRPSSVRLPRFVLDNEIGLGEVVKRILSRVGVRPCGVCRQRAAMLDRILVFSPRPQGRTILFSSNCTTFKGKCTGFGGNQCVTAPESLEPDAATITQCCSGSFQYPWIELCPGAKANRGCSFCLF